MVNNNSKLDNFQIQSSIIKLSPVDWQYHRMVFVIWICILLIYSIGLSIQLVLVQLAIL